MERLLLVELNIECISCHKIFDSKLSDKEDTQSGNIIYCEYCGSPNKVKIGNTSQVIKGGNPSEEDLEWIKSGRELIKGGPDRVDSEANALVTLGSTLLTAYIGALTFLKITDNINNIFILILLAVSIILWLWSIAINLLWVAFPKGHELSESNPKNIMMYYAMSGSNKYDELKKGRKIFILALAISVVTIVGLPVIISNQTEHLPQQVQFIISPDQIQTFENMSIGFEAGKMRTNLSTLIEETDNTYKIRLNNGMIAKFNKDLVKGIIYQK
jgi:hypothetical protein